MCRMKGGELENKQPSGGWEKKPINCTLSQGNMTVKADMATTGLSYLLKGFRQNVADFSSAQVQSGKLHQVDVRHLLQCVGAATGQTKDNKGSKTHTAGLQIYFHFDQIKATLLKFQQSSVAICWCFH